jgi:hypothetical protein
MIYSYGKNSQGSIDLFENRKSYENLIVPIKKNEPYNTSYEVYIDLFINKPFYTRVDDESISVFTGRKRNVSATADKRSFPYDEKAFIKRFPNSDISAMNFLVDAFVDMANYYNQSCLVLPQLSKDGPLGTLTPRVGWSAVTSEYETFLENTYSYYLEDFYTTDMNFKIKNFDDFVNYFSKFLINSSNAFSVLFSSFNISRYSSPLTSGLMVEIAIDDHSDDFIKTANYFADPNYVFLMETAKRFGFYFDRNVPWRLIANLSSKTMISYMERYGINNTSELFKKQFVPCYEEDLRMLKDVFINGYIFLLNQHPNYESLVDDCVVKYETKKRERPSIEEFYSKYPNKYFLKLYVMLRAASIGMKLTDPMVNNLLDQTRQIYAARGEKEAVRHVYNSTNKYRKLLLNKNYFTTKYESVTNTSTNEPTS